MILYIVDAAISAGTGLYIGYVVGRNKPLSLDDTYRLMNRVVNLESIEEHERLVKVRMARNKVKTTRVDSGANAKVMRMRVRKRRRQPKYPASS